MYYIHCFNMFVCVRGNPGVIKQWDLKHGGWRRTYQPWLFLPLGFWKQYEWIGGGERFSSKCSWRRWCKYWHFNNPRNIFSIIKFGIGLWWQWWMWRNIGYLGRFENWRWKLSVLILKHPILLQSFLHNYLRIFILKHFQNIFTSPLISWNLWLVTYKKKKILPFIKFMKLIFFVLFQIFIDVPQVVLWKFIQLSGQKTKRKIESDRKN